VNNHTVHVNGLYRHGFLIAPVVLKQVEELIEMINKNNTNEESEHLLFTYSHLLPITNTGGEHSVI
jgi:glycine oxidase